MISKSLTDEEAATTRVSRRVDHRHGAIVFLASLLAIGLFLPDVAKLGSLRSTAILYSTLALICIVLVARKTVQGVWSVHSVSLIVLVVFHIGVLPEFILGSSATLDYVGRFVRSAQTIEAIYISGLSILAFALGLLVLKDGVSREPTPQTPAAIILRASVSDVGSVATVMGVVFWLWFAHNASLTLGSSYSDYLDARSTGYLQLSYYVIGAGVTLAATSRSRLLARFALVAFLVFAAFAFPIGLRGEVLFPAASTASVLAMQRRMPNWVLSTLVFVLLLIPIAVVSQTRDSGLSKPMSAVSFSPIRGLSELGSSLAVVEATVVWHQSQHEDFYNGRTYLAPTLDAGRRYLLRQKVEDFRTNSDYMSTQISVRVGNIGGSVIGEAYNNFRLPGAITIMFCWGVLLSWLSRMAFHNTLWLGAMGSGAFIFQLLVRNSFASFPTVVLLLILLLMSALVLSFRRNAASKPSS